MYPIIIGIVKKIISLIDKKYELLMGELIELLSLAFAALPYRTLYFGIEDIKLAFIVIGVKMVYKISTYVFYASLLKKSHKLQINSKISWFK